MSFYILADSPEAVVGLLSYGVFIFAAITLLRELFKSYSKAKKPSIASIPSLLDLSQRYFTCAILVLVCMALCFIFAYISYKNIRFLQIGYEFLFASTAAVTITAIIIWMWVLGRQVADILIRKFVPKERERVVNQDIEKIKAREKQKM